MDYKIVADSSCDLNDDLRRELNISRVPLTISVNGRELRDDESLDVIELLQMMKRSQESPKTACPSPYDFIKEYSADGAKIFAVTISSKLSATYNNAVLAKNMMLEKGAGKFIHVFDSLSASIGETLVSLKIAELAGRNLSEMEIVNSVSKYIKEMRTFFLLESLDNLIKAGRINKVIGKIASVLSIKLIMGDDDGSISLVKKVKGSKKAFRELVNLIGEVGTGIEEKVLGIAHCNCIQRALELKNEVLKKYNFKRIVIVEMSGLSTAYSNEGGIVIAF